MKTIDMRFDSNLIHSWIGKSFVKYKCDAFEFTNSVTQIVGLYIGDEVYAFTNVQEAVDYFGTTDDMAVAKLSVTADSMVKSAFLVCTKIIRTRQKEKPVGKSNLLLTFLSRFL